MFFQKIFLVSIFLFQGSVFSRGFLPNKFKVEIEQVFVSKVSNRKKVSPGMIYYQFPQSINFKINGNSPIQFISNAQRSWFYRPPFIEGEQGQVTIKDTPKFGLLKIFDSLTKDLSKKNPHFSIKKIKDGIVTLELKENVKKDIDIESVELKVKKGIKRLQFVEQMESMILVKKSKNRVNIVFKKFEEVKKFKKDYFIFKVPKNTVKKY
ncbi:outer-membrane lipoprotein carrier protein LolA [Bacteriovoracaceae bacterium]|nr:outer-membrane lipoprotein carrier protein LolA [Bacteriovoracaceae bacterium]